MVRSEFSSEYGKLNFETLMLVLEGGCGSYQEYKKNRIEQGEKQEVSAQTWSEVRILTRNLT